jgi:hypothetical protein
MNNDVHVVVCRVTRAFNQLDQNRRMGGVVSSQARARAPEVQQRFRLYVKKNARVLSVRCVFDETRAWAHLGRGSVEQSDQHENRASAHDCSCVSRPAICVADE